MEKKIFKISNDFIIFIDKLIPANTGINLDELKIVDLSIVNFDYYLKFTIDKSTIIDNPPIDNDFYFCIVGNNIDKETRDIETNNINNINITRNINNVLSNFQFSCITYFDEELTFQTKQFGINQVNKFPQWNLYDNQQVNINRWLNQICAVNRMYGHRMTYFRTEATETNHTFQNNYLKNIVDIKKLMISIPNNLLPTDINIYSDWDFPAQDEFSFDVVDSVFRLAFGEAKPKKDDIIFFPLINKFLSVTSVQPKNSFMGIIGWWQVFVANYTENEAINFSEEMEQAIDGTEFEFQMQELNDSVIDGETIIENTQEEKINVNQSYTNRLEDSQTYIDLKLNENVREFYHKRLNIVSINPDSNSFPVTMYNCTEVDTRTIGLIYNLGGNLLNKKIEINKSLKLSLNITALEKFKGEIFDVLNDEDLVLFTISSVRVTNGIKLFYNFSGNDKVEITDLTPLEFYQINLDFNFDSNILKINIFKLQNKVKSIYFTKDNPIQLKFNNIHFINMYGGKYYYNDLIVYNDKIKIYEDNVNPILNK